MPWENISYRCVQSSAGYLYIDWRKWR